MKRYLKSRRGAIAFAICCLTMSSCTWEEFPDPTPELQKPVDMSFTTVVNQAPSVAADAPKSGTRSITPGTDFGSNESFPTSPTPYRIGIFLLYHNGNQVFSGSYNMRAQMTMPGNPSNASWKYFSGDGSPVTPRALPGASVQLMAYHPWSDKGASPDGIPFDFTSKVNAPSPGAQSQTNLLVCKTNNTIRIPNAGTPIPLSFTNVYTKVVLKVRKREEHSDGVNNGLLTETAIENISDEWIKNKGEIDPKTGYVSSAASEAGRLWDDTEVRLKVTTPKEFTFLVPAFMDSKVEDDAMAFVLTIDGQPRIFSLRRSELNYNTANRTYGFEQNRINTYNLVYNNSLMLLSLQSWNSIEANAEFGNAATNDPNFTLDLNGSPIGMSFFMQSRQPAATVDYPKDNTPDPTKDNNRFKKRSDHLHNTYLSSVLLGGNGPNVTNPGGLYDESAKVELPYHKLQITGIDVGGKDVVWQDEHGGLVAKDVCRNYRGSGFSDWRLPRVCEMKTIMMWAIGYRDNLEKFLGYPPTNPQIFKASAQKYWTATEADMGIANQIDNQETAWYVIGYRERTGVENYRVTTMNKQEKAFIRCVRELD